MAKRSFSLITKTESRKSVPLAGKLKFNFKNKEKKKRITICFNHSKHSRSVSNKVHIQTTLCETMQDFARIS